MFQRSIARRFFCEKAVLLTLAPFALRAAKAYAKLSGPVADRPEWASLSRYSGRLTRREFEDRLKTIFLAEQESLSSFEISDGSVRIPTGDPTVPFAEVAFRQANQPVPVETDVAGFPNWTSIASLPPAPPDRPLDGLHIALDPGHIGGSWAVMEARHFRIGKSKPVREGEMTLRVAQRLEKLLRAQGAKVSLVRKSLSPTTDKRPSFFSKLLKKDEEGSKLDGARLKSQSELLFYRVSEIRARADLVNRKIQPDMVICLHFNAEEWGDPEKPTLSKENHLHLLVNGCYHASEIAKDDIRFEMLIQTFGGMVNASLPASEAVARSFAKTTQLPPYTYKGRNAARIGTSGYVWTRNLLANRLYRVPTLFLEPYVMNSQSVWERIQAGDYEGTKTVGGLQQLSIFREYAEAVANGIVEHVRSGRATA
jgi:N-acetylmuramoyl-L-alanine amidase